MSALLDSPIHQGGAPVRAMVGQQADPTALVAEQHEVFAEEADEFRGLLGAQLPGWGLSVASNGGTAPPGRRPGPHSGQQLVLFLC